MPSTLFAVIGMFFIHGTCVIAADSQYTQCENGESISRSKICDGKVDCEDGSDEKYVGTGFKCVLSSMQNGFQKRRCVLPPAMIQDDVIDCHDVTDRCFDSDGQLIASKCYRCLDGREVISLSQVCDGVLDCTDLSDECPCVNLWAKKRRKFWGTMEQNPICLQVSYSEDIRPKFIQRKKPFENPCNIGEVACKQLRRMSTGDKRNNTGRIVTSSDDTITCVTSSQICNGVNDCPLADDEEFCPATNYLCSGGSGLLGNFCDGRIDCPNFDDECSPYCWLRHDYCDDVIMGVSNTSELRCESAAAKNKSQHVMTSSSMYVIANDVCDGVINCVDTMNDEAKCPSSTHFYCRGSPMFINSTQRYDGVRDCEAGRDECGRMMDVTEGRDALIRSPILIIFIWSMGIMALGGNAVVLWKTSSELWKDREVEKLGKLAKCNRIFVINLAIADFLMGIYLITIGTEAATTDGRYCARDRIWRSGATCVALGFINQVSSQTSVYMLLLMTTYRLYGTLNPFKVERTAAVQSSIACCAILWILSLTIASIPLAKGLAYYFAETIWLPLPFLPNDKVRERELRELVIRMNTLTFNTTGRLPDLSWQTMVDFLQEVNVTPIHPQWDYDKVRPFGYYNWFPNCIPNLYPRYGDTAWAYAAAIILFNFCAFCYITIAYFIIYKASSRPAVRKSVRKRSRQWRNDNKKMQKKIFILVATDVMCWLPICVLFLLNLTKVYRVRRSVVDITGAILLPINSAINPLIYSNALLSLFKLVHDKVFPERANKEFLPFSGFRSKFESTSSNDDAIRTSRKRTVRFAHRDESLDRSVTDSMLTSNDVLVGSSVAPQSTDITSKRKPTDDDARAKVNVLEDNSESDTEILHGQSKLTDQTRSRIVEDVVCDVTTHNANDNRIDNTEYRLNCDVESDEERETTL